jgi:excisionase family DNA binding protein
MKQSSSNNGFGGVPADDAEPRTVPVNPEDFDFHMMEAARPGLTDEDIARIAAKVWADRPKDGAVPLRVNSAGLLERLPISESTLRRWQRAHRIPYEKIGREVLFDLADVNRALRKFRRAAIGE